MSYVDALVEDCKKSKEARAVQELVISNSSELGGENIKDAIYIIEQIEGDTQKADEAFDRYKKSKDKNCSQLNGKANYVMYVGSSTTGLKSRLSQDTGKGKTTPSLNFAQWFKGMGKYKNNNKKI